MVKEEILCLSVLVRLLVFVLLELSAAFLPLFDASPLLVRLHPLLRPLLRWDLFHFTHIAQHSYAYEHEWAFFPALPLIIRSRLAILAFLCDPSQLLYTLSLYHLPSPKHALLATLLSLLPSNPVTAYFAPYTEPFFTYFSYWGMLCCTRQQWFFASLLFALAGTFRSNGVFLAGFLIWGLLVRPFLNRQKVIYHCSSHIQSYRLSASPQNTSKIPGTVNNRFHSLLSTPIPRLPLLLFSTHIKPRPSMVFPFPALHLLIRSVKVLERRFLEILVHKPTSQLHLVRTNPLLDIRI